MRYTIRQPGYSSWAQCDDWREAVRLRAEAMDRLNGPLIIYDEIEQKDVTAALIEKEIEGRDDA